MGRALRIPTSPATGDFARLAVPRASTPQVIVASDWRVVTQASPAVVPPSKPLTLQLYVNKDSTWDNSGGSNGVKMLVKWPKPITVSASPKKLWMVGLGAISGAYVTAVSTAGGALSATIRARPILNNFDITQVTWNNTVVASNLTLGASWNVAPISSNVQAATSAFGIFDRIQMFRNASSETQYGLIFDLFGSGLSGTDYAQLSYSGGDVKTVRPQVYMHYF